jgi:hypothetical protein
MLAFMQEDMARLCHALLKRESGTVYHLPETARVWRRSPQMPTTDDGFLQHIRKGAVSMRHEARLLSGLPREHQRETEESGAEQQ